MKEGHGAVIIVNEPLLREHLESALGGGLKMVAHKFVIGGATNEVFPITEKTKNAGQYCGVQYAVYRGDRMLFGAELRQDLSDGSLKFIIFDLGEPLAKPYRFPEFDGVKCDKIGYSVLFPGCARDAGAFMVKSGQINRSKSKCRQCHAPMALVMCLSSMAMAYVCRNLVISVLAIEKVIDAKGETFQFNDFVAYMGNFSKKQCAPDRVDEIEDLKKKACQCYRKWFESVKQSLHDGRKGQRSNRSLRKIDSLVDAVGVEELRGVYDPSGFRVGESASLCIERVGYDYRLEEQLPRFTVELDLAPHDVKVLRWRAEDSVLVRKQRLESLYPIKVRIVVDVVSGKTFRFSISALRSVWGDSVNVSRDTFECVVSSNCLDLTRRTLADLSCKIRGIPLGEHTDGCSYAYLAPMIGRDNANEFLDEFIEDCLTTLASPLN